MPAPGSQRAPAGQTTKRTTTAMRPPASRLRGSLLTDRAQSPADAIKPSSALRSQRSPSVQSTVGTKRKEREFESEPISDTNIRVIVRCRGRNDREVKENSGVVVATEGIKGQSVELSMGPNALGNKTYHFDKVFSPSADQATLYEDAVAPILNEMLSGFNCTIFAYGQTGTGKTYTMSGDMNDELGLLSDNAGIIPRVLYSLFKRLEDTENAVKCSFIELYNEELRDLLSLEDNTKLKIYEDGAKKGHISTMVQGMEETHIDSATAGIKLLQQGSYRRQVAATKCNDLSSRSHTIFTVTVFIKRTMESGEDFVSSGKLNLVDLAGSENIQRSGAENKRAAEAGLINKSLLTLGRVINSLVDKSQHIPYRESKLTRLLQDSLGGRTKTCIIATISPARSNLEETISTLDYAFRAKNIRNKPQINSLMSKKTLLREYTYEIEKLKSDLIATRQRNGVYISNQAYEDMTVESESRRILSEEQRAKIEVMESSLKNKVQELFTLTSNFNDLKKDNESTQVELERTNDILQKTDLVLKHTEQSLKEETALREAHQATEEELHGLGSGLIRTLDQSVSDVGGLRSKLRRRSDLHALNRKTWQTSANQVQDVTAMVDARVELFQLEHSKLLEGFTTKMETYLNEGMDKVASGQQLLDRSKSSLEQTHNDAKMQTSQAQEDMNEVLEEIKILREDVKAKVGGGLQGLSVAAARISDEVVGELGEFHSQLRTSYTSLGDDFKGMFEGLVRHLDAQKSEAENLRRQLQEANRKLIQANKTASVKLQNTLKHEKQAAQSERENLMVQIRSLIEHSAEKQESRLKSKLDTVRDDMETSRTSFAEADTRYGEQMDQWMSKENRLVDEVATTQKTMELKMENDWAVFDEQNISIQNTTKAINEETVRIVEAQMNDMEGQMQALDEFVTRARSQNDSHHEMHLEGLDGLATTARQSYGSLQDNLRSQEDCIRDAQSAVNDDRHTLLGSVPPLTADVREPLVELRANIERAPLTEYTITGETPQKTQYEYPTTLPRTEAHESLIAKLRGSNEPEDSSAPAVTTVEEPETPTSAPSSPTKKAMIYNDAEDEVGSHPALTSTFSSSNTGLREVDTNLVARPPASSSPDLAEEAPLNNPAVIEDGTLEEPAAALDVDLLPPPAKKQVSAAMVSESKLPMKKTRTRRTAVAEGRENDPLPSKIRYGRRLRNVSGL